MRTRARTDAGHKAIVQALRKVGCKVSDTSRVGCGFPDLVVRQPPRDHPDLRYRQYGFGEPARVLLMEIKEPKGKLTPAQERFIAEWPETVVIRSVDEALMAVGISQPSGSSSR